MSVPKVSVQPDEFCSFSDSMKLQYKHQSIISTRRPFSLETVEFASLSMIENADQVMLSEFMFRGQVDQILEMPGIEKVNVEDIIDSSLPLKVVIDGPPGIGKTTLCRKLLSMWSNRTHKHFDLVLYCPLGNSKIAKAKDLADIFLFDSSKVSKVVKWMSDGDGKGLLIIFDGWDELSTELQQSSLATSIICGEKLKQCSVIVTSRSYASSSLLDISTRHIQVIGFTEAEVTAVIIRALIRNEQIVQELIDKKREDEKNGRIFTPIQSRTETKHPVELINYLEVRNDLRLLCHIPLICFVIIKVCKSERSTCIQNLSGTLTPIYKHVILEIIKKHQPADLEHECHSLSSLPTVLVEPFKNLCQLAYNNISNKGIKLQEHVQSQLNEKNNFRLMKLFTNYYNGKYQFLHLSIQEFLAAWWIAEHEKTEEVFNRHFDDHNFRMCLRFVAGLTGLKHVSYNQYFNEQLDLQCERVPAFGLKAQYFKLPSNCQIISVDSTMSEKFSMLLQLLYESGNTNLHQLLADSIKNHSLCLNRVSLSLFDSLCLNFFLRVSHEWDHLHLGKLNDQILSLLYASGGSVIQCEVTEVMFFQSYLFSINLTKTQECYIVMKGGQYNCYELSHFFHQHSEVEKLHLTMSHPTVLHNIRSFDVLEENIGMNSTVQEVDLKFNGQANIRIITGIIRGVARNETIQSFSLTVTSLDHPIPAGIIEDLFKHNETLQALSLNIPDELLSTPLNIVEVNTPLIKLELSSALMISLLQQIKGLDCLILHEQYLPHLIFHSHTRSLPIGKKAKELSEILRNCTSLKALKVVVLNMNELFANDALCKSLEVMLKQNQTLQSFELASEGSPYNHVPVSVLSSLITGINNNTSIVDLSVPIPLPNSQLVKDLFEVISQKEALTQCHIDLRPDESYQSYSDDDKKQKMIALYKELKPEFAKSIHVTIRILGMEFKDLVNSNHEVSSCSGLITKEDLKLALEEGFLKYCVSSAFIQGEAHAYVKSAILSLPHNEAIEAPQVSFNSFSINCYGSTDGECWKLISSDEMDEKIIAEIQERAHKIADMRYSESNVPPKTSRQFDVLGAGDNVKIASDESASEEMAMSPNFDPLKFCKKRCHGRFGDYKEWIQIINSDGVQIQFQKLLFALMPWTTDVHLVNASKNLSEPSTSLQLHQMECETSHFQSLSTNTQSKKLLVISVGIHSEKVPLLTNIESSEEKLKPFNDSDYAENLFKLFETEAERVDRRSKRITKLLRKGAYEVEVPLKWHYFGVILRKEAVKSNGVLTKSSCVEYGKSLDMSVEDVDKALESLHMSKLLLYYHDSPVKDIVFVKLDSLINIVRELVDNVKYYQTSEEIVPYQLSLLATKGYLSVATLKSCKAVQAIAEGVYDKNCSVCSKKILEVFQYVNITAKISEGQFFMPAILPVRNVSDPRNLPTTIPLCFYSNNCRVPMGSYCAVVIHLLSADAENRWQITSNDVNFFNYYTLRKNNSNEQDLKIVLVEQLSWIEIYCEEISDVRIKVREEIEEVIRVVMDDKFEPGFKCPCGAEGDDHIAKFRLKDSFAIICTWNKKEQKLSESDLDHYCSWFMDQGKIKEIKRRRRKDNHSKERNNESKCVLSIELELFKISACDKRISYYNTLICILL